MTEGERLYFAYGSNMHEPRMRARVPSARAVGAGRIPGLRIAFRKRSRDGSTKCDLETAPEETVWGVLYRFAADEQPGLDAAEGEGYAEESVTVATADGLVEAFTYRAREGWIGEGIPYGWYRDLVVAGARAHDLPPPYVAALADLPAADDPDEDRDAEDRPAD